MIVTLLRGWYPLMAAAIPVTEAFHTARPFKQERPPTLITRRRIPARQPTVAATDLLKPESNDSLLVLGNSDLFPTTATRSLLESAEPEKVNELGTWVVLSEMRIEIDMSMPTFRGDPTIAPSTSPVVAIAPTQVPNKATKTRKPSKMSTNKIPTQLPATLPTKGPTQRHVTNTPTTSSLVATTGMSYDVSEIVKSSDGSDLSKSNGASYNKNGLYAAIATILISCLVILGLSITYFFNIRKRANSSESIDEESSESIGQQNQSSDSEEADDEEQTTSSAIIIMTSKSHSVCSRSVYSVGQTPKAYNEDIDRPTSKSYHNIDLPISSRNAQGRWPDPYHHKAELPVNRTQINVIAPPGKLGIVIATCSEGPMVHGINSGSPLEGLIFKGDLIVTVGDKDTKEWNAHDLTLLLARNNKVERKIAVLRPLLKK